jgi:hypothetical protein
MSCLGCYKLTEIRGVRGLPQFAGVCSGELGLRGGILSTVAGIRERERVVADRQKIAEMRRGGEAGMGRHEL